MPFAPGQNGKGELEGLQKGKVKHSSFWKQKRQSRDKTRPAFSKETTIVQPNALRKRVAASHHQVPRSPQKRLKIKAAEEVVPAEEVGLPHTVSLVHEPLSFVTTEEATNAPRALRPLHASKVNADDKSDHIGILKHLRSAIFVIFVQLFDAPPASEWYGQHGTISSIIKTLHMAVGSRDVVARVLEDATKCIEKGVPYCSARKLTAAENSRALIQRGSKEEQIVADCIEDGQSYQISAAYVNDYRKEINLPHIGVSAVGTWCERMNEAGFAKTSRISKMKQGMLFLSLLNFLYVT